MDDRPRRRAPAELLAAALAIVAALPGLRVPALSDDWALLHAVANRLPAATPWLDFRPLFMASFRLDRSLWGLHAGALHLTNIVLLAAATVLVVRLARRFGADERATALAGALFALHPWHVANAAWLAGRSDPLFAVPYLAAWLLYDRWRVRTQGWPIAALALFALALLCKETAGSLPGVLLLVGLLDRNRRPTRTEWWRGLAPLLLIGALHFLLLRPLVLGGGGRSLLHAAGWRWLETLAAYGVAGFLPLDASQLAAHPALWATVAALAVAALGLAARRAAGRVPRLAIGGPAVMVLLVGPSVVGFQERYMFLPAAGAAIALASLIASLPVLVARAATTAVLLVWVPLLVTQWWDWRETARAGEAFLAGLAEVARDPGVDEIALANVPLFVRGGSVAGDFRAALLLRGERAPRLSPGVYLAQATADQSLLDGDPAAAVARHDRAVEIRFRTSREPFSYRVGTPSAVAAGTDEAAVSVRFVDAERTVVRIAHDAAGRRAACYWSAGQLERLF